MCLYRCVSVKLCYNCVGIFDDVIGVQMQVVFVTYFPYMLSLSAPLQPQTSCSSAGGDWMSNVALSSVVDDSAIVTWSPVPGDSSAMFVVQYREQGSTDFTDSVLQVSCPYFTRSVKHMCICTSKSAGQCLLVAGILNYAEPERLIILWIVVYVYL